MKPFKILYDVETSALNIKEKQVDKDTTFINKNISKKYNDNGNHIGYNIGIQEWWWNEDYTSMMYEVGIKEQATQLDNSVKAEIGLNSATSSMELLGNLNRLEKQVEDTQDAMTVQSATTSMELLIALNEIEHKLEELTKIVKGDK